MLRLSQVGRRIPKLSCLTVTFRDALLVGFAGADDKAIKIERFNVVDFFDDGSLYLLDPPGHSAGHLCALARTMAYPPSFVFMGPDACYHAGVLRPTEYTPLPRSITPLPMTRDLTSNATEAGVSANMGVCPGALLQQLPSGRRPVTPFFRWRKVR